MADSTALVHRGQGHVELVPRAVGGPGPSEVVVRPTLVGITSDDLDAFGHPLDADRADACPASLPVPGTVLGSEAVGIVEAIGTEVGDLAAGDRVSIDPSGRCGRCAACLAATGTPCRNAGMMGWTRDGSLATAVRVPASACHVVPSGVPDERAIWAAAVAHGIRGLRRSGLEVGDDIAVFGADHAALAITAQAARVGARRVVVVDPFEARRCAATSLGATSVIDPGTVDPVEVMRREIGTSPDVVFVSLERCSPAAEMYLVQAFDVMRIAARVIVLRTQGRHGFGQLVDGRLATPLSKEADIRFVGPSAAAEPLRGGRPRGDWAAALESLASDLRGFDDVVAREVSWSALATPAAVAQLLRIGPTKTAKSVVRMGK